MKVSKRDTCDRYYILQLWGFAIFVHYLHKSEDKDFFHNHPWDGISFIFGSYIEERLNGKCKRRLLHFLPARMFHRIEIVKPVWTLFFHFRRKNHWQVVHRNGTVYETEPWRGLGNPDRSKYYN